MRRLIVPLGGLPNPTYREQHSLAKSAVLHLLPRISRFGRWAPVLNAVGFSLYHLWAPWANLSRILFMLPVTYLVWRKQNIYLSIVAHCTANIIGWLLQFGLLLG